MTSPAREIIENIAPKGVLRAAINLGNPVLAQQRAPDDEPAGISVDLARKLGQRLGVQTRFVTFDSAGKVFATVDEDVWDVAFMAIDPVRAEKIRFTEPYVIIEGTYMVKADSGFSEVDDVDRDGVRVAVGKGAAYDLFLSRALKHARIERAETSAAAIDLFVERSLEAVAGVRQPLAAYAAGHPGWRVLEGRFTAIEQAMAVPRDRAMAGDYLCAFVRDVKASGFVRKALARSGQNDAAAAP